MTTATAFRSSATNNVNEQRVARFAGTTIGLFTVVWAFLLSGLLGENVLASEPWQLASHGLSLLSALAVYLYCRRLAHRTGASGLLCFAAVAFFVADVALGFLYSPFFGIALIAWAASARRPFLAATGVLALGAAVVARLGHELDAVVVAASGVIILAIAAWPAQSTGKAKVGNR
ncbi:hypothetical protein ABIE37_001112 [Arthrobacter bambusae]|uniref:DUF2157 domain-containing protein n=1 Tax=Arthrobacter bambusae TaxID=1338426 RepID=A0ABV2P3J8_9MICC